VSVATFVVTPSAYQLPLSVVGTEVTVLASRPETKGHADIDDDWEVRCLPAPREIAVRTTLPSAEIFFIEWIESAGGAGVLGAPFACPFGIASPPR
jgi:hypothetical protein